MMTRPEKVSIARYTAASGMVLLKNEDHALPLAQGTEIALMGVTSYCCHRMGVGSGDMLAPAVRPYDRGLVDAGLRLCQPIADLYRRQLFDRKEAFTNVNRDWAKWTVRFPEPTVKDEDFAKLAAGRRAMPAVVTIGRNCGEAIDLVDGPGSFRLHSEEEHLLKLACDNFDTVIVLLNVCGVIDLSPLDRYPIKAVVFTGLAGETSGDAVADVVTGAVCPSGRLSTTWAKRYRDYPTTNCFGTMEVPYNEGIYVGYRYFDTFGVEPRYPFGYGLSYTTFALETTKVKVQGSEVTVWVKVTNTGAVAGSEVVQMYLSAPDGKLEKPYQELCDFDKTTDELAPGASETVELFFDLKDMASYCETCASSVLEAGDYILRVGTHSRDTHVAAVLRLPKTVTPYKKQNRFQTPETASLRLLSKAGATPYGYAGEAEEIAAAKVLKLDPKAFPTVELNVAEKTPPKPLRRKGKKTWTLADVKAGKATVEDVVAQFTDDELASMVNGVIFEDFASEGQTTGVGGFNGKVRAEGGEFWHSDTYGIPVNNCVDGPSGVRLSMFGDDPAKDSEMAATVVAYPCSTLLAQTWDRFGCAEAFGNCICDDLEISDIDGWLAPGVNIHRNPLCGRNFEYYSEDPLLAGLMAGRVAYGVQNRLGDGEGVIDEQPTGRYVTMKHFAANNQEYERGAENNVISERALREIYLKAFWWC